MPTINNRSYRWRRCKNEKSRHQTAGSELHFKPLDGTGLRQDGKVAIVPGAGSKSPVEHFTKSLAKEIGGRGITVNCVAPGPLKTSFFYPAETDANLNWLKSMSINGDIGEPTDIVPLVRFLVSDEAKWITAQTVYANGGLTTTAS